VTCIVGIADGTDVWIGGDSAAVGDWSVTIRSDPKVFTNGPFVMGFCGSFRQGQLLAYSLSAPEQSSSQEDFAYMVTTFVDAVRECLAEGGIKETDDGVDRSAGHFLVGYRGVLYQVESDFQVAIPTDQAEAIGCAEDFALGVLHALPDLPPERRIRRALEIAEYRSGGVAAPFLILKGGARDRSSAA
jgi:ATP-dependent protease HslVU (ClpYQ) peptidase subunit